MRGFLIAAAGLSLLAGCAAEPPPVVEPLPPALPTPLPGETFPDPEDPAVEYCLIAVSRSTGTAGVVATAMTSGPGGTTVTIASESRRWQCQVDDRGRVVSFFPL